MRPAALRYLRRAVLLVVVAVGCARSSGLPDDYLGRWYPVSAGGGIEGSVEEITSGASIVIQADSAIRHYAPDGSLVSTETFELSRGGSIFGEAWLLDAEGPLPRVMLLHDPETLTIADNVYDGHGVTYRRTPGDVSSGGDEER